MVTLTVGAVLCIFFEYVFRQNRQQLLSHFLYKQSYKLLLAMKEKVQQEKQMSMEAPAKVYRQLIRTQQEQYDIRSVGRNPSNWYFPLHIWPILANWSVGDCVCVYNRMDNKSLQHWELIKRTHHYTLRHGLDL